MLTEQNEIIPSTDVDRLIALRATLLARAEASIADLQDINREMQEIYKYFSMDSGRGFNINHGDAIDLVKKNIDSSFWRYMMEKTQIMNVMDTKTKSKFHENLEKPPEFTKESVLATFENLYNSRGDMFEQGIINLFKNLSWDYKTNQPQKFGKRMIKGYYFRPTYKGYLQLEHGRAQDEMLDLERIMLTIDGKPQPQSSLTLNCRINDFFRDNKGQHVYEDNLIKIKGFKNKNAHIEFKRPDLVEKMNLVIAKHYPGALPAPK